MRSKSSIKPPLSKVNKPKNPNDPNDPNDLDDPDIYLYMMYTGKWLELIQNEIEIMRAFKHPAVTRLVGPHASPQPTSA